MSALFNRIRRASKPKSADSISFSSVDEEAVIISDQPIDGNQKEEDEKYIEEQTRRAQKELRDKQSKQSDYSMRKDKAHIELMLSEKELEGTQREIALIKMQVDALKKEKKLNVKQLREIFDEETVGYADNVKEVLPDLYQQFQDIKTDKDLRGTISALYKQMTACQQLQVLLHKKNVEMTKPNQKKPKKEKKMWKFEKGRLIADSEDFSWDGVVNSCESANPSPPGAPLLRRKVYKRLQEGSKAGGRATSIESSPEDSAFLQLQPEKLD